MHQPLHAVSQVSKRFPGGDRGGSSQFVLDHIDREPRSLHWFWDDSVNRDSDADAVTRHTSDLMRRLPRTQFKELRPFQSATEFSSWAGESHQLARTIAYGPDLRAGDSASNAPELPKRYVEQSIQVAEQRLTLAGYRLTEVLRWAFRQESR
jgi:hypothetical protein